eukprot:7018133-Lingulodinium_polyedra.AAC.1
MVGPAGRCWAYLLSQLRHAVAHRRRVREPRREGVGPLCQDPVGPGNRDACRAAGRPRGWARGAGQHAKPA